MGWFRTGVDTEPSWSRARLFVDGRGVPEAPDMDAVLHRSAEGVVRGDMRLRGELAPKSEWAAWLVPDAALLDTLSLSINVDSTDVQAQLTVPELLWKDVVVKRTELNATALGRATTVNLQSHVLLDTLGEDSMGIEAQLVGNDIWEGLLDSAWQGSCPVRLENGSRTDVNRPMGMFNPGMDGADSRFGAHG